MWNSECKMNKIISYHIIFESGGYDGLTVNQPVFRAASSSCFNFADVMFDVIFRSSFAGIIFMLTFAGKMSIGLPARYGASTYRYNLA